LSVARVLVIEDNDVNLELMTYMLRAWGHEALVAADGKAGLAVARAEQPDIILCDIQMPGMDGYDVARNLKADAALAHIPLIAVTALAMVGDREKAFQAGFDAHVSKPIDTTAFMDALMRLLPGHTTRPASFDPAPAITSGVPLASELCAPREGLTILIVDDVEANHALKTSLLEPAGYTVESVHGVESALASLRQRPVDLIMSDMMMGAGHGLDLLAALRADAALREIPLVFLTSTALDHATRARALALGAAAYLVRPIDAADLLAAIRTAIRPT
jgi:two-component system cell cycle response regulator